MVGRPPRLPLGDRSRGRSVRPGGSMHLSYSKLNTYRQCPLRYRLTYEDRLPRRPRRLFRAARRIHHALMVWLTYAQRGVPSLPEALRAYDQAWDSERQPAVRDLQEYAEGEQI